MKPTNSVSSWTPIYLTRASNYRKSCSANFKSFKFSTQTERLSEVATLITSLGVEPSFKKKTSWLQFFSKPLCSTIKSTCKHIWNANWASITKRQRTARPCWTLLIPLREKSIFCTSTRFSPMISITTTTLSMPRFCLRSTFSKIWKASRAKVRN